MPDKEKQVILKAIGDLGRRVTTADVATKTGMPVLVVHQKLNQVAMETNGHMAVGTAGDIVYSFTPGFTNAYLARGIAAAFAAVSAKVMAVLYYLLRISFGVALILSLVIIVVLLFLFALVMSRGLSSDDDRDGGDFGSWNVGAFPFTFWDWMILRDLFLWNAMTSQPVRYDYRKPTVRQRKKSNFLLNCFSFLFGDGDPNEGLEEKRWQVIAQVIKLNGNVVTAEQLAPYTGSDSDNAVLPVLVRFNGRPEVTASGNIVYVFESLQSTAADLTINPPTYLHEFPWRFTNVKEGELLPVFVVAGLNLFGAWTLWNWIKRLPSLASGPLMNVIIALCVYGSLFVAIPVIRTGINFLRNQGIEKRNDVRRGYAEKLLRPTKELSVKLSEASEMAVGPRRIDSSDVVYTTEKDALDQPDELSERFDP